MSLHARIVRSLMGSKVLGVSVVQFPGLPNPHTPYKTLERLQAFLPHKEKTNPPFENSLFLQFDIRNTDKATQE